MYIVSVNTEEFKTLTISSEAYTSLTKAQKFIENRSDNPIKLTEFKYQGDSYNYCIYELIIK